MGWEQVTDNKGNPVRGWKVTSLSDLPDTGLRLDVTVGQWIIEEKVEGGVSYHIEDDLPRSAVDAVVAASEAVTEEDAPADE